jgi:hypothetical protein
MPVRICNSYRYYLIPTGRLEGDSDEDQCSAGKKFETHGHRIASSPASPKKGSRRWYFVLIALLIALSALPVRAQTPDPQPPGPAPDPARPPLNPFPAEQTWSFWKRSRD